VPPAGQEASVKEVCVQPVALEPNLPATFYRGSSLLAAFRGMELPPGPEDWVASTTSRFGQSPSGQTRLTDGTLLADVIADDPDAWLGPAHVARYGADPAVLVKLLDAGQRLPLHAHPNRSFAMSHLSSPYGKTEAWIILDAAPDAVVHLGFSRDVAPEELARWTSEQDIGAMLSVTNRVPVSGGDAILCPAGTPHAIGANVLLVVVQEPTDFSVLLEWNGFPVELGDALLGLPFDLAMECVDRRALSPQRLDSLKGKAANGLLPPAADEFFGAELIAEDAVVPIGFSVLVVTGGAGLLSGRWGSMPVYRGRTIVVPFAAGPCQLTGAATAIRCRPPTTPAR
jgi:mannose-6-phosphate isomerase